MPEKGYTLRFPPEYDAEQWIWTAKGYVVVAVEVVGPPARQFILTVRDPTRLSQDVEAEVSAYGYFSTSNLIVVRTVDRLSIEAVVEELARGDFAGLVPKAL